MKLIITGSRHIKPSLSSITDYIKYFNIENIKEIVCGMAEGVDREGEHWASHYNIEVKYFKPNWDKWGKAAGPKRNEQMAQYGDAVLLIWDGLSHGSFSMKQYALCYKLPIYEVILKKEYYSEV